jgi:hypothetical protein
MYVVDGYFYEMKASDSFIHLVVCPMTGPKPVTNWALHIVRSKASSFKWKYPLLSLTLYGV